MNEVTQLLPGAVAGEPGARDALYMLVYKELCVLARSNLARTDTCSQLDPPSLVNEAYLRMAHRRDLSFENRRAFFGYASRVMRAVILDYVRDRAADKRGGGVAAITLNTGIEDSAMQGCDLIAVDAALQSLARLDARGHDVFEMHFFAGMEVPDIGATLDISPATVKRDLRKARAFVFSELGLAPTP
ncbi:MAG: hypothetical protein JWQ90_1970 [Hydrocarboniphaga sp.]|uniref:ECF-type sigma factor n=1 Tax=Hydrocarboniphaga sp. TaxID=2033016 RepID=UPI00263951C4|nr:ECF-type sigma factor [Hydrocarboniphaga sp.]MDB5969520.1 hypothetical protein [Hydrocarboniphaga sp.]